MTSICPEGSYFYGGCVLSDNRLILLYRENFESEDAMCFALFIDGNTIHKLELSGDFFVGVASINNRVVFAAQLGNTVIMEAPINASWNEIVSSRKDQRISDVDDFGELTKIRIIESQFWICGQFGQLYKLSNSSWSRADNGLRALDAPDFEDIAGKSENDIIGVGLFGEMHRYNGNTWKRLAPPTNQNINSIIVSNNGKYNVVGFNGLVMVGENDIWDIIGDAVLEKNYDDLITHDDELFLLHSDGIDKVHLDAIEPVIEDVGNGTTFRKFASGHGRLIAVCSDRLFEYNDGKWAGLAFPPIP
jgi:hypothetical protein